MKLTKKLGLQLISIGSCMCFVVGYLLVFMLSAMHINSHTPIQPMPKPAVNFNLGVVSRANDKKKKRKYSKLYNQVSLKKDREAFTKEKEIAKPLSNEDLAAYLFSFIR